MKFFIYISAAVLLLTSCEKYIDFDTEVTEPKLVVNGVINPDSAFDIHISRSLSVIDNADLTIVEDATVTILDQNGAIYEILAYEYDGHYKGVLSPVHDEAYSIEVSAPEYETVTASTAIPSLVDLSNVDTLGVEDVNGYEELELTITFQDIPNESNYYMLEVYAADIVGGQIYLNPMYIRSDDVALGLEDYTDQVVFSDELFDGDERTVVIYVEDTRAWDDFIEVRMTSITQELERYVRSHTAYERNFGNPFSQPVQVFSNIEGGFGIFTGYQVSRKKITF